DYLPGVVDAQGITDVGNDLERTVKFSHPPVLPKEGNREMTAPAGPVIDPVRGGGSDDLAKVVDAVSIAIAALRTQGAEIDHGAVLPEERMSEAVGGSRHADHLAHVVDGRSRARVASQGTEVDHDAGIPEESAWLAIVRAPAHDLASLVDRGSH